MENQEITDEEITSWNQQDSQITENTTREINIESLRVIKQNQDYNLDNLISSLNKNIDLGPEYQRRSRWTKKQQSKLIESFLMNIPVPPIFLYEKAYYEYEVIDGKQRLEAIKAFHNNEFKLTGLEFLKNFNGSRFSDLDDTTKRLFFRRTITATILLIESMEFDKYDLRMILFDRLNTGGIKLNGQELRNATYASKFNDLIMELSSNDSFRSLWNIPIPENDDDAKGLKKLKNNPLYKSMMDCELVLRFFAIKEVYDGNIQEGSMKFLLDETMNIHKDDDIESLDYSRQLFLNSVNGLVDKFGVEIILNTQLNPSKKARNLYDSILVAYSYIDEEEVQSQNIVKSNISKLLEDDDEYDKIISKGNSIDNIIHRVNKAKDVLTQIM
ncbi:DUF262 domain-containing protein [Winogradskyella psychrotolerans]|uniref:DUF262 domain-containing protein n=1 Tax=Winogradskyella psychrotolerans TaxID=1344585 RepID=UPI001C079010|nr:DUF262 domain-containing protein [Winogradskyella psychrotolerans]MBU2926710.1 DUF262 domain-containing protein [Winogradskyella psychrotolerans]